MKKERTRVIIGLLRAALVALLLILQLLLIVYLAVALQNLAVYVYVLIELVALIDIYIMMDRNNRNSSFTVAWLIIISVMPVFGHILYILWGRTGTRGKRHKRTMKSIQYGNGFLQKNAGANASLNAAYPQYKRISSYLEAGGFPVYENTSCEYFPLGELQFERMIEDMEKAEKFIFLEYYILGDGILWRRIQDVLIQKAKAGVEIRLMFDDFGSLISAPERLCRQLGRYGIKAIRYNPIHRYISRLYINFRNHQKMTVIDGNIGYTGGTNLADEYANLYEKHGHWKDTAIRLEGDAVWSMTVNFLQMWDGETCAVSDYDCYRPNLRGVSDGFFQPFSDGPANNPDNPAEVMYKRLITGAKEYVYITTPYLVIDGPMTDIICTAAKSGVDVRIITPKVWDHWYVHMVTRSNYTRLIKAGVQIFEYSPGYMHAKTIISDGDNAVTGSINMDYRSFYLHFENGVWICGSNVLEQIRSDFLSTQEQSERIELAEFEKRRWYYKLVEAILRIFAIFF